MNSPHFPPSLLTFLFIFFFFFFVFTSSSAQDDVDQQFFECLNNYFNCGETIKTIWYPFWGDGRPRNCGLEEFHLTCHNNDYTTINIDEQTFRVLEINQSTRSMRIARNDLWEDFCPQQFSNTTLNHTLFEYRQAPAYENITLFYNCTNGINTLPRNTFDCPIDGEDRRGFYADDPFLQAEIPNTERCSMNMTVPVLLEGVYKFRANDTMEVRDLVNWGFDVEYRIDNSSCSACLRSRGVCWVNSTRLTESTCLCRDGVHPLVCPPGNKRDWKLKFGIGFGAAGFSILVMGIIFFFYLRRNKKHYAGSYFVSRNISSHASSITDLEKAGTYLGVHIFSYNELERATNKFDSNKELGDGGFGTVYKGKLRDGRVVAVKRLYENNYKRVEQFMNEVEILTHLRHTNLVSLYGCTTHHCRELLLVYEYVPNGTVADHLHGELAKPGSLTWTTRMSIAIETASALVYLHASDVIHRDVKTSNILLDNNFGVKVADFGLSRLFPTNVTHVSTAPQGTPGYVDPEYHQCYQLTDKSDVFSFGVVLIELISSKPAVDITRHRHDINLSNMAINKIKNHTFHELVDPCLGYETDYKVRKMIKAVAELAFQCLQNGREMRPSMVEVWEELKRIQSEDYDIEKEEGMGIAKDDVGLLKNNVQTLSPDTVSIKWVSISSTSSSSIS